MAEFDAVLVYDGDCPFCSAAATALRQLPDAGTIPWEADGAQAFLEAQFDDTPFALVFVDGATARVWTGREAARELCDRAGMPVLVQDLVGDNYETMADTVRSVTGVEGDTDPYHGEYPLAEDAEPAFEALVDAATATTHHLP